MLVNNFSITSFVTYEDIMNEFILNRNIESIEDTNNVKDIEKEIIDTVKNKLKAIKTIEQNIIKSKYKDNIISIDILIKNLNNIKDFTIRKIETDNGETYINTERLQNSLNQVKYYLNNTINNLEEIFICINQIKNYDNKKHPRCGYNYYADKIEYHVQEIDKLNKKLK